jgi:hypothetical protein
MFGPADNRITPDDRARVYEILGFGGHASARSAPISLDLTPLVDATRLLELHARALEEHQRGQGGGRLRGLTEYGVGVELMVGQATFGITEVKKGSSNHVDREVDQTRTIIGTIHTHPWDVIQSIGDVRNLIRANDILGGVVTYTGRLSLLIKHPNAPEQVREPLTSEMRLQAASLRDAPDIFRGMGLLGGLSAAFDLPIRSTRDPYIAALCRRLGLVAYAGQVTNLMLQLD